MSSFSTLAFTICSEDPISGIEDHTLAVEIKEVVLSVVTKRYHRRDRHSGA